MAVRFTHPKSKVAKCVAPVPYQANTRHVGLTDGELLRKFVEEKQQDAFTELVQRHSTMVMAVCQKVLRDQHDAEDVFQATFLILAQQANKIRKRSVAAWLYRVAYRASVRAARQRNRRGKSLVEDIPSTELEQWLMIARQEEHHGLLEELDRLPQLYQQAIVLCCLEGASRADAAQVLGVSIEAIHKRIVRGTQMLRMRLARRGVIAGAALTTVVASPLNSCAAELDSLISLTSETCTSTVLHADASIYSTTVGSIARQGVATMSTASVVAWLVATVLVTSPLAIWGLGDSEPMEHRHDSLLEIRRTVDSGEVRQSVDISQSPDQGNALLPATVASNESGKLRSLQQDQELEQESLSVLLIGEQATWEWRYLQQLLTRSSQVETTLFLESTAGASESDPETGLSIADLEAVLEELSQFDAVCLMLSSERTIFERVPELSTRLQEYVGQAEGGLIVSLTGSFAELPLLEVLPVEPIERRRQLDPADGIQLRLAEEEQPSPLNRLFEKAELNTTGDAELPLYYSDIPDVRATEGAIVWAVHAQAGQEAVVPSIVASEDQSQGPVLFVGLDETWRWRSFGEGQVYAEFWRCAFDHVGQRTGTASSHGR